MTELQEQLAQLADWASLHLQEAQVMQKWQYDQKAQQRTFLPGDRVLLLLPMTDSKLLARWQGPYGIVRQTMKCTGQVTGPTGKYTMSIY